MSKTPPSEYEKWTPSLCRSQPKYVDAARNYYLARNGCQVEPALLSSLVKPNCIRTTRFTPLTWLPKSLFFQFLRAANIFFLCVSILVYLEPIVNGLSTVGPFLAVLLWTALKDLYEDVGRRRDDDAENMRKSHRFNYTTRSFEQVAWQDIIHGDVLLTFADEAIPADAMVVCSSEDQIFVSTVNLDGETNLKERRAADLVSAVQLPPVSENPRRRSGRSVHDSERRRMAAQAANYVELYLEQGLVAELDEPRATLTDMSGSLRFNTPTQAVERAVREAKVEVPSLVGYEHFVPRGCVLRNTGFLVSVATYVGRETKTMLNTATTAGKISNMQKVLNRAVQVLVTSLFVFCIYATILAEAQGFNDEPVDVSSSLGLPLWIRRIFWYWILLYQVVPISLYVTFEILKLILGWQINRDPQMVDPRTGKPAVARTADLVEELGQVNFVFSDKTGTLTENEMIFARVCIAGSDLGDFRPKREAGGAEGDDAGEQSRASGRVSGGVQPQKETPPAPGVEAVQEIIQKDDDSRRAEVRWFFLCLATCHSGQVDIEDGQPKFSGSSPDEVAFLEAGASVGFTFTSRRRLPAGSGVELVVAGPNGEGDHVFTILAEIPFTSERKRMTVVCRYKGEHFCISKGADNVMGPLCDEPFDKATQESLLEYSKLGLRTLTFASKMVEQEMLDGWLNRWNKATLQADEVSLSNIAAEMEHSLLLAGVSAIEDKLQQGVPEAITSVKAAGIRFWVLTGDKTETAVEIARACKVFTEDTKLAYMVNCTSQLAATEALEAAQRKLTGAASSGLVIDGTLVRYVLSSDSARALLYQLAIATSCCVCCRLSPKQKRKLVELVREQNKRGITLAIGDGANDVSMIQGAHVGVGVRGKEGNQAVQASDVAISQFRFLVPLLFCHGRRAYRRVAIFLLYKLYVHITIATGDMIWAHQNRFSGNVGYPEWLNTAYAFPITPFPLFVVMGFDMDVPDEVAINSPELYSEGLTGLYFNAPMFAFWMLSALFHGSAAWLGTNLAVGSTDPESEDFWRAGCCGFFLVVVFVSARLWFLSLNPWWWTHLTACGLPIIIAVLVMFILSSTALGVSLQPDIEGEVGKIFTEGKYLGVMAFLAVFVLAMDLGIILGQRLLFPTPLDRARRLWRGRSRREVANAAPKENSSAPRQVQ